MRPRILALLMLTCGLVRSDTLPHAKRSAQQVGAKRQVTKQGAVTNQCQATYLSCTLPGYAPIGTPCWCATPTGPVVGVVNLPAPPATDPPARASKP
jgi:hypothetical protein